MIGSIPALDGLSLIGSTSPFGAAPTNEAAPVGETSFASMLADAASGTVGSLKQAESLSVASLQGGTETREVVDGIMSAEQSLQTAISIRDKIVSSYLEISRMAI